MAAILSGLLPAKKKDQYSHLNTRWGDAAISAPMHGGWNKSGNSAQAQANNSPDLDRDLPPTPPQHDEGIDRVFIVHDEEEGSRSRLGSIEGQDRDNIALSMSLSARKRKPLHNRNQPQASSSVLNSKFAPPQKGDAMPLLGTAEAAATVPLPESRINSPVSRNTTPVLSFRSRLANPNLADVLSPVAEGFAKNGPSTRVAPITSSTDSPVEPIERSSSDSSIISNMPRRSSVNAAYSHEGLGSMTMTSQVATDERLAIIDGPQSRGIGVTAHMRASSRGPRTSSREPQPKSIEAFPKRSGSVETVNRRAISVERVARRAPSTESSTRRAPSIEPYLRRAPSVEPVFRRALSIEPISYRSAFVEPRTRRAPSVETYTRRAPSIEPATSRGQSVDHYPRRGQSLERFTHGRQRVKPADYQDEAHISPVIPAVLDLEPLRRRAPSMEPTRRRAPSIDPTDRRGFLSGPALRRGESVEPTTGRAISRGPPDSLQRTQSREPRGRRGISIEPKPRVRFHSEAAHRTHRRDSFSSNDGSLESEEEKEGFDMRYFSPPSRVNPNFTSTRKPHRRRSIAAPVVSPTITSFNKPRNNEPYALQPLTTNLDLISSRAGLTRSTITLVERRAASRNQSQTRTRGVYADLQDDFSMLAREVQNDGSKGTPIAETPTLVPLLSRTVFDSPSLITQSPRNVLNPILQTGSPIVGPSPPIYQAGVGTLVNNQWGRERNRNTFTNGNGCSSDSSQPSLPSTSHSNATSDYDRSNSNDDGGLRAVLASITRDRHDQLRREEREKAREKVTKRLEQERERILAIDAANMGMSDFEGGRDDRTRRVYGSSVSIASDSEVEGNRELEKVLVPDDEIIWG